MIQRVSQMSCIKNLSGCLSDWITSGSRQYVERCGSTFDTNYQWEPPTCPRHGMDKMNPVSTAVMNLTGSFLEGFMSFGTVRLADSVRPIRPAADII